ncbi:MAG: hypothetical protein HY711_04455, partial [Candidatus Melainabacteria bacterium]|nr:hypothetical protein [Candidatus Melainabacteria bacterium]
MATQRSVEALKIQGPSGFIEVAGQMLVVDYGKIYLNGAPVGFLHEDGFLQETTGPLGNSAGLKPIEDIPGSTFRGIDATGLELELPGGDKGPSGTLAYNGVSLLVTYGRISTHEHHLVGELDDNGTLYLRDPIKRVPRRQLDENTQLTT